MNEIKEMHNRVRSMALRETPNVLPLAKTLVEAAAERGASMAEIKTACDLVLKTYEDASASSADVRAVVQGEVEAAFQRIEEAF